MFMSVIIPVYNGCKSGLSDCLDSVLRQTTQPAMELLVVDDGSTDGTAEMLDAYARTHENIKVYHLPHQGQAAARNEALRHAAGEWLFFLDADDRWADDYLASVLPFLTDDIDVLQTGYTYVRQDGDEQRQTPYPCTRPYRYLSAWSKVVRHAFLTRHHILFPQGLYYDDPVWAARLWQAQPRLALASVTGYLYTHNTRSVTANPKPSAPVRCELRKMGLHWWSFGWLRLRLTAHFIKQHFI